MGDVLLQYVIPCLLVFIPTTSSFSFGSSGSGVVLPNDPYIYIGKNLTLTCNLTKYDEVYNSNYLSFSRKNDEVIPSRYITVLSTRSIVLRYPMTSSEYGGNYLCKLNRTTGRPEIIGTQYVMVEYEPKPVTEVKCRVYNWENMTCTWDLGVQFIHPKTMVISLVWTIAGDSQHDCLRQTATSCSWWKIDGDDSFKPGQDYHMGVSIENKATKPSTFYPKKTKAITVDTSKIVEPASVKDVTADKNSTCVSLSWRHEKTRRDKVYRVDFKQTTDRHWQTKHVGESETLTLCGLHPNTLYDFQVLCMPRLFGGKEEGFWSKPTPLPVRTDEDVPAKAPELLPGSYVEKPYHHYNWKRVRIYWKRLSTEDANGNITYYRIKHRNCGTASQWETTQVKGETQDILTLIDTDSYVIRIQAATSKGLSKVFSEIRLPAKSEKPKVPEHIVEADNASKDTRVTISWKPVDTRSSSYWRNLISYTVFWCRGSKLENCQDAINSADVAVTETEYVLHLHSFEMYMFGVAVNALSTSGEIISSGFKWNTCIYIKNTKPEVAPRNFHAAVYQPDSALSVEWDKLSCEDTHAYIKSYIVHICPSVKGENCSGETSTFQVDKDKNVFTIHDLAEGSRYKVWVNVRSAAGLGPRSSVLYGVVVDRRLNAGEIGGIVVGSLFVLIIFLFSIILCTRQVFRTVKQRYFVPVPIEIPHTSLPPLPPIPMPPRQNPPDSDSSDGIYEKIVEGPPSPSSSTESTTGVEAPLINNKWKFSSLKQHIYGKKERARHSSDSGRGSLSQSADTLLMRLHPSHLRKHKKNKKSNKSESDSGVIVDGRGQVCTYTNTSQSEKSRGKNNCDINIYNFSGDNGKLNCGEVNPYSCVDIVEKIDSKSEQLLRKSSCDKAEISKCKGSTLSLPPGLCKMSTFMSQPLDYRAQSAGDDLDLEHRRLSSMRETKEFESSDMNSEAGTLDSVEDIEHETTDSFSSREPESLVYRSDGSQVPGMNSYLKFVDSKKMESMEDVSLLQCNCDCHKNNGTQVMVGDGYVTEAAMISHSEDNCECLREKVSNVQRQDDDVLQKVSGLQDKEKNGLRPCSQVFNLPPHYFGSMGTVVDPSRTTEL
ncbi:interleukin-6 receptor subunit beta-like [Mercenaria mercenaria]|uniref:interleukin-6 receptor subunit beta-like n=1 Tax=Mercenaria mercenaria TaxID=6596 RepID=UPI00234F5F87|nr:interleukin-6 receptor subunit beta-like [Mercenaria mercenaria]XP_053394095.1 interleukin-6 receptor subunit beta-like [Mercenaria mercenaria]XP_053394096.1 interleukin-6 receptor subunit beta-like [Mercenaria mercenaria]XP_053394097.1 interleukin-6 receptor subunit beta-like [Mercenaria mercenaria]